MSFQEETWTQAWRTPWKQARAGVVRPRASGFQGQRPPLRSGEEERLYTVSESTALLKPRFGLSENIKDPFLLVYTGPFWEPVPVVLGVRDAFISIASGAGELA